MFDEQAEDLFENAPCGYLSTAPDGTLLRVNATFLEWTGYRREELVGVKRFQDLLSVGGRIYHETHYAPMLRLQGSVREIAVDIVGANGDRLSVLVNSLLVRDADGTPQLVRTTVFDATERKRYEQELLAARNRERAAREQIERLQVQTADVAAVLQRSLLAGAAPEDPRYEIATLYAPAVEHLEVGGDWHDAFRLSSGRVGIVVGDVVGRGLIAATAMGQLRSAVRALAGAGLEPAAVLDHLDTFVEQVDAARYATLAFAAVDPSTGAVTCASAGHLPAVVLGAEHPPRLFRRAAPHLSELGCRTTLVLALRSRCLQAVASCSTRTGSSSAGASRSTPGSNACSPSSARDRERRPRISPARCSSTEPTTTMSACSAFGGPRLGRAK